MGKIVFSNPGNYERDIFLFGPLNEGYTPDATCRLLHGDDNEFRVGIVRGSIAPTQLDKFDLELILNPQDSQRLVNAKLVSTLEGTAICGYIRHAGFYFVEGTKLPHIEYDFRPNIDIFWREGFASARKNRLISRGIY